MTTTTTPRETAEAAEQAARAACELWVARRVDQQARATAVAAELDTIAGALAAARVARMTGEDRTSEIAALVTRERAAEAEAAEVAELVTLAQSHEAAARSTLESASAEMGTAVALDIHDAAVVRAAELDLAIGEVYGHLVALLNERAEIADGARAMARAGIASVGEIPFDWRTIAHATDRCRYTLPGAG